MHFIQERTPTIEQAELLSTNDDTAGTTEDAEEISSATTLELTEPTEKKEPVASEASVCFIGHRAMRLHSISQITVDEQPLQSADPSEQIATDQESDENASADPKTTLEAIRDAITHPLATISEAIHNVLSPETDEVAESIPSESADIESTVRQRPALSRTHCELDLGFGERNEDHPGDPTRCAETSAHSHQRETSRCHLLDTVERSSRSANKRRC